MLGGFILLLVSNWKEYKLRATPINIVVALFLLSYGISTFVGIDWYHSLWDNHERMLGLFTIVHYILYYYIATTVIREWRDWRFLLRIFLFAGSLVVIIGFWQRWVNPQALINNGATRVSSTLGNPIYYSDYGLFLFFIGSLLAFKEKAKSMWQWYAGIGAFLGFIAIFIGGTRGALLGVIGGIGLSSIVYLFAIKENKHIRQGIGTLLVFIVLLGGFFFMFRKSSFVQHIPVVGRLVQINFTRGDAVTRLMAWQIAIKAWQHKPILGWGPDNFYYAFNQYYNPAFLEHGYGETWFDNAHNVIFNTLAEQGIVGLILYLSLFIVPTIVMIRAYRKKELDLHIFAIGLGFLWAHLVSLSTVFENPTSYIYFFLFLALIHSQIVNSKLYISTDTVQKVKKIKSLQSISLGLTLTVLAVVSLFIYSTDINPARANMATLKAIQSLYSQEDPVGAYQTAKSIPSPHIDNIRSDFARSVSQVLDKYMQHGKKKVAQQLFLLAITGLRANRQLNPLDVRVHILQAELDQQWMQYTQNPKLLLDAEATLFDALKRSPKRQQIQFMLAGVEIELHKTQQAIALYQDIINEDPKISEGWWRLAYIYNATKENDKARKVVQDAEKQGVKFSGQGKQIVRMILSSVSSTK